MDFTDQDLSGARFVRCDLSDAVVRGSWVVGLQVDTHDLTDGPIWVNGVDVTPYVEQQLNAQLPGRELKHAQTPEGLREAWAAVEEAWADVVPTAVGKEQISVEGEWTFEQTLRHLVLATNAWLHGAILQQEQPFHWIGIPFAEYATEGGDMTIFREPDSYEQVLQVRAEHQAIVRDYLATVDADTLAETRPNPWASEHQEPVLACLHVILNEEWEHLRYAVRDLATIT
ncbi:hypothetical protein HNR19_003167 [Nocardioides thalensis]|uniref:DinB-like domain-containing protein n=1 Tax=Nocardioides thalensis TaxID=1914755 RepID=A0A853C5C3_9ACTN|nr:DinB family protein [Nocardioides thalensis]NYJ02469.1 hypothetical protein [Nocardioides thalensis]